MHRHLTTLEGKSCSPTSFHLRELLATRFAVSPAILIALYSGQIGCRGASVLSFRQLSQLETLVRGSTNANFATDFSSGSIPTCAVSADSYGEIINAIHGLADFGRSVWYNHVIVMFDSVHKFVADNHSADTRKAPACVRLTLMTTKFVVAALSHPQSTDALWWRNYWRAVDSIRFATANYAILIGSARNEYTLAQVDLRPSSNDQAPRVGSRDRQSSNNNRDHPPAIPEDVHRAIPRNSAGEEPRLRYYEGLKCGQRDGRCSQPNRTRHWKGVLPSNVPDWDKEHFKRQHCGG